MNMRGKKLYLRRLLDFCNIRKFLTCNAIMKHPKTDEKSMFRNISRQKRRKTTASYRHILDQSNRLFSVSQTELNGVGSRNKTDKKIQKCSLLSENQSKFGRSDDDYPSIVLTLPDGTRLLAVAFADEINPAINVYWDKGIDSEKELLCFAEYNPDHSEEHMIYIGVYCSDEEATTYYEPFVTEGTNYED